MKYWYKGLIRKYFFEWNEFVMFFFYLYCVGVRFDRVRGGR